MKINKNDISKFYRFFNHTKPTEIIVFDKIKYPKGKVFWVNGENDFINKVIELNTKEKVDVYIGGRDRINKNNEGVISSSFIFCEIDEHDVSKPDVLPKLKAFLQSKNISIGMIGTSGGGYHVYIPHPLGDLIDAEVKQRYQSNLLAFRQVLKNNGIDIDEKVFDLQRVSRVLGTWNWKRNAPSNIVEINTNIELDTNMKNLVELINDTEIKQNVVGKADTSKAITILDKYNISSKDAWLYELIKNKVVIKSDTGGNSIILKNGAIICAREGMDDEETKIIGTALSELCEGRNIAMFYGWLKKVKNGEFGDVGYTEIDNCIQKYGHTLTTYAKQKEKVEELKPFKMSDFLKTKLEKDNPIIENFIPEQSIISIWGEPASCKSFVTGYLSNCVATGNKFLGQMKTRKVPVLYLSTENPARIENKRFRAIFRGMGMNPKRRHYRNLQFMFLPRKQIGLMSDDVFFRKLKKFIADEKIKLLVIDTLSPMILDLDDNKANQIVELFNNKLFPLVDEFKLSILFLLHSQKTGKDYLGSVKLKASVEVSYELVRDSNTLTLLCHKGREGEYNFKFGIDFENRNNIKPYKVNFNFLESFEGKANRGTKKDDKHKIETAKEVILSALEDDELTYKEMVELGKIECISDRTMKRAINILYETDKTIKKNGKEGGYILT